MAISNKRVIDLIAESSLSFTRNELIERLSSPLKKTKDKKPKKQVMSARDLQSLDSVLFSLKSIGFISKKNNSYKLDVPLELDGKIKINSSGNAVAVCRGYDIIVKKDDTAGARNGDGVTVRIRDVRGSAITGEVKQVSGSSKELYMSRVTRKTKDNIFFTILDSGEKIEAQSRRFGAEPEIGAVALVKLSAKRSAAVTCVVEKSFDPEDESSDVERVIMKHNLPKRYDETFPSDEYTSVVKEEAAAKRKDYRKLLTVTIDGDEAKDFDDAVSMEKTKSGYMLYVHIADVSAYVAKGSPLDAQAVSRGNSYYLGETVIPMLPEILSNGLCSLREKVDRLTMTAEMALDKEGNVTSSAFYRGVIKVDKRLTYTRAAELIKGKSISSVARAVRAMSRLAVLIKQTRVASGRIDLNLGDEKLIYENGKVKSIIFAERLASHELVEEFMLTANEAVSKFIRSKAVPSLYRVHEAMSADSLDALSKFFKTMKIKLDPKKAAPLEIQRAISSVAGTVSERVISLAVLKSMMSAFYGTSPLGHYGLAFDDYTHFTSPIRRYPDLIVHRVLKSIIDSARPPYTKFELDAIGEKSSQTERAAQKAERDLLKLKSCRLMRSRVGETFEALVSGVSKYGFFVSLTESPIEGMVPLRALTDDYYLAAEDEFTVTGRRHGRRFRLGDKIQVRLAGADPDLMRIDFVPL